MKFYIQGFIDNLSRKSSLLKSDIKNGYFTWRPTYIYYHVSLGLS